MTKTIIPLSIRLVHVSGIKVGAYYFHALVKVITPQSPKGYISLLQITFKPHNSKSLKSATSLHIHNYLVNDRPILPDGFKTLLKGFILMVVENPQWWTKGKNNGDLYTDKDFGVCFIHEAACKLSDQQKKLLSLNSYHDAQLQAELIETVSDYLEKRETKDFSKLLDFPKATPDKDNSSTNNQG